MTIERPMLPPHAESVRSFSLQHPPGDRPDEKPSSDSPSQSDDQFGMAWWNALTEKDRRHWMRLAGDTGRAVDALGAFKAATGGEDEIERETEPRKILIELFTEETIENPDELADLTIARLGARGFIIMPRNRP